MAALDIAASFAPAFFRVIASTFVKVALSMGHTGKFASFDPVNASF
ncbi:hypothetical protein [Noviherbaspirillum saxi]|nr:hypothetical protein [Noviherbaspirillum saxi]